MVTTKTRMGVLRNKDKGPQSLLGRRTEHVMRCRTSGVNYVTRRRGQQILDRQARHYLNMSGAEFLRRYEAGEIEDPDRSEVVRVSMLIPFVKR